jgi:hypothetical protein
MLTGDARTATLITSEALSEAIDPGALVSQCMVPAMDEVVDLGADVTPGKFGEGR